MKLIVLLFQILNLIGNGIYYIIISPYFLCRYIRWRYWLAHLKEGDKVMTFNGLDGTVLRFVDDRKAAYLSFANGFAPFELKSLTFPKD